MLTQEILKSYLDYIPETGEFLCKIERVSVKMYRLIMDCPKGSVVDHINRNGLDNRKENLRIVSVQENGQNRRLNSNSTTKIAGVTYREKWKNWEANIKVKGKTHYLGKFQTKEEAVAARKTAEKEFSFHPNRGTV